MPWQETPAPRRARSAPSRAEIEQGRRQMFEVAEADLGVRGRPWPGFTSPFPPPAKGTPDSQTLPLPGTLTFSVLFLWYHDLFQSILFK